VVVVGLMWAGHPMVNTTTTSTSPHPHHAATSHPHILPLSSNNSQSSRLCPDPYQGVAHSTQQAPLLAAQPPLHRSQGTELVQGVLGPLGRLCDPGPPQHCLTVQHGEEGRPRHTTCLPARCCRGACEKDAGRADWSECGCDFKGIPPMVWPLFGLRGLWLSTPAQAVPCSPNRCECSVICGGHVTRLPRSSCKSWTPR
jgi:hypothetical protein